MIIPTNVQILKSPDGKPAFVVIPYSDYMKSQKEKGQAYIPHEVVSLMVDNDWTIIRAWREYFGVTQEEVATRLGISQSAYSQQEANPNSRKATRERIAEAFGIPAEQLEV